MKSFRAKVLLFPVVILTVCPLFAVELVYTADSEQSMTFYASIDQKIEADSATGEKKGTLSTGTPLEKKFSPGIRNQALRIGYGAERKEEYCVKYSSAKNISAETGTIMFWIKSEDWQTNGKQYNLFFSAKSNKERMLIYKYSGDNLFFILGPSSGNWSIACENIGKWLTGEWHFITCTWTPEELRLYVDGKMKSAVSRKDYCASVFTEMQIGANGWAVESGLSAIDELKIYSKSLDADTIALEFAKYGISNQDKVPVVAAGQKTPELDGRINDGEYAFSGTGFLETSGKYADKQSRYYLSYDRDNLYVAVSSPQIRALKSENNINDSSVWLDDSVELWMHQVKADTSYQIIVNSKGTVFDTKLTKVSDPGWNLNGLRSISKFENEMWTIELALPLKEIDLKPGDDCRINIGRTFQADGEYFTCIAPVRKQLGYSDKANFYRLSLNPAAPAINLASIGDLNGGNINFQLNPGSSKVSCEIDYATVEKRWFDEIFKNTSNEASAFKFERKNLNPGGLFTIKVSAGNDIIYRGFFEAKLPSPVSVEYIYTDIPKQLLQVVVKNESGSDNGKMLITLTDKKSKAKREKRIPVTRGQLVCEIPWDISNLPDGDYDFEAVYIDQAGKAGEKFIQYYRKTSSPTPWDGTKAGIYTDVPPPWVSLKTDAAKVEALKQIYSFGKSLLPVAITANNKTITSRPVSVNINGKTDDNAGHVELMENTRRQALYKSSAQIGNVNLNAAIKVDFDGMLWVDLTMSPASGDSVKIDRMFIDIPLKKEFAEQVHANSGDTHRVKFGFTGIVPPAGWHKNLFEKPAFWIGNDDAGLSWFAENLKGWHMQKHEESVEIIPGNTESIVRLNIVDTPLKLSGERKISFGVQGTPVKEPVTSTRTNRLNKELGWGDSTVYFNYFDPAPEFVDSQYLANLRKVYKDKRFFHYISSNGASPYSPDWGYWGKVWTSRKLGDYIIERDVRKLELRNKWVWTYSCLNSKSFLDFFLWSFERCIDDKTIDINNLYYDLVGPRMCSNAEHGCGWTDDFGNSYPTLNLLGCREFQMRIYELMKKKKPDSMHIFHVTTVPAISAVDAFADALVDGETFFGNDLVEKETYFGIYTPEMFRVSYYGQKWGTPVIYIPQFQRAAYFYNPARHKLWTQEKPPAEMQRAMRHFIGYALIHDTGIWSDMNNIHKELETTWKVFKDFLGEWNGSEEFIPYWHADSPVEISSNAPQRVIASAYRRGGKAVLIVMNDTASAQNIGITIDASRMFKRPCKAVIMTSDKSLLPLKDKEWQAKIPEQDFAVYLIKAE